MKRIVLALAVGTLVALAIGCRNEESGPGTPAGSVSKEFLPGGDAEIRLESGSFDVMPSSDNRIHMRWDAASGKKAEITISVIGKSAEVKAEHTPHNFHGTIELPAATNVRLHLGAGDLDVGPIKGDKDIEVGAGNVTAQVGNSSDWANVEASVSAGNLEAPAFNSTESGLVRSLHWSGPGKYRLHATLGAGNLTLRR
jgi:hypothetical protein